MATFLELDDQVISSSFSELPDLIHYLIEDYNRYERNSTMLLILNRVLKAITRQTTSKELVHQLYIEGGLL